MSSWVLCGNSAELFLVLVFSIGVAHLSSYLCRFFSLPFSMVCGRLVVTSIRCCHRPLGDQRLGRCGWGVGIVSPLLVETFFFWRLPLLRSLSPHPFPDGCLYELRYWPRPLRISFCYSPFPGLVFPGSLATNYRRLAS